ncbi:MAG: winged helix-turn-helix domain-containing protein [Planctomycetaceae bacterium]|jgi:DNA-binding winged helix-turn-helix (wHTH) protein|nr:winged helix-turn-helix domain-containing protein [Planctomycetaceae bacterium]
MTAQEVRLPPEITFCDDSVIGWQNRRCWFSPQTYRLLQELYSAEDKTLSKEDVRQDVIFDDEVDEGALRQCIAQARKEIRAGKIPLRTETITRRGYRLVTE